MMLRRTKTMVLLVFLVGIFAGNTASFAEEKLLESIAVSCDAPATNYGIEIQAVWLVKDEIYVISHINKKGDIGGAAITNIKHQVKIKGVKSQKVKHYIAGKTWNWWEGDPAEFIKSTDEMYQQAKEGKIKIDQVLYGKDPNAPVPKADQK
jgi:zinc protease